MREGLLVEPKHFVGVVILWDGNVEEVFKLGIDGGNSRDIVHLP